MKEAIRELIDPIEAKLNQLLDMKEKQERQEIEIEQLHTTQSELYKRCMRIEHDNKKLRSRIERLEEKLLESNLIMHGVKEDPWEDTETRKDKVYRMIAHTIDQEDLHDRLNTARGIPIRSATRLGCYRVGRNRPVSICFEKKDHADVLFKSKSWLPKGIFVNKEYTQEIENQQRLLRPILKLA